MSKARGGAVVPMQQAVRLPMDNGRRDVRDTWPQCGNRPATVWEAEVIRRARAAELARDLGQLAGLLGWYPAATGRPVVTITTRLI